MSTQGKIIVINKLSQNTAELYDYTIVYVARGSPLGNPFKVESSGYTRSEAIHHYYPYLQKAYIDDPEVTRFLDDLVTRVMAGENIALECFCSPKACHAHTVKSVIESLIVKKLLN